MSEHKKPGRPRQPINHGTLGGARTHYRRGEPLCEPCRDAQRTAAGHKPFKAAECGTRSGYGRHLRLGEPTCQACRDANHAATKAGRERRAREPLPPWDPRHGNQSTYNNYGCRCVECTAANARKSADRRKRLRERAALDELVRITEELGLYDEEQP